MNPGLEKIYFQNINYNQNYRRNNFLPEKECLQDISTSSCGSLAVKSAVLADICFKANTEIIENDLIQLFTKYSAGDKPVIMKVNQNFIGNLARSIAVYPKRRRVFCITGRSGTGKSTTIDMLMKKLPEYTVTYLPGDNFYRDRSDLYNKAGSFLKLLKSGINFDEPTAVHITEMIETVRLLVKGKPVIIPKHEPGCITIPDTIPKTPPAKSGIVIFDSIFSHLPEFKKLKGIKIYFDCPDNVLHNRWWDRIRKKCYTEETAETLYRTVVKYAEIYIKPYKKSADIVINSDSDQDKIAEFMKEFICIIYNANKSY